MAEKYSIGEFAKKTGTTIRALRYYDEIHLLKPTLVSPSGRRYYSNNDIIQLQKIVALKFLGYSLEKINEFLHLKDWDLKDSLAFQKQEMQQKKKHIERVIRALDQALHIMEDQGTVNSSIFISLINNIQMEDEHKEWLKGLIPESTVEGLYEISEEKQQELNTRTAILFTKMKEAVGKNPESDDVQELIQQYMDITEDVLGGSLELIQDLINSQVEIEDDPKLFPSPFTFEEEEWVGKAMEVYLKRKGVLFDGDKTS
ncbi:MerR family transcriptional regulator [Cytobacillus massiliigabonensis]|uniref:MerR family transcriptional regulator n=1 Tax=Cytobacillus massiliigabonensis TaxID=1871011 RepID=UPI000C830186|nr:MerR family transcriptional regulator [Cytobacillus massiliigabonensis]